MPFPTISYMKIQFTCKLSDGRHFEKASVAFSQRKNGFAATEVHVGFLVNKVALGQVFLPVLRLSPVSTIPPLLHIDSYTLWGLDKGFVSGRSFTDMTSIHHNSKKKMRWVKMAQDRLI